MGITQTLTPLKRDWQGFNHYLSQQLMPQWQAQGINFRLAPPGARLIKENHHWILQANHINPGVEIEYRVNGQDWASWQHPLKLNTEQISLPETLLPIALRARLAGTDKLSRTVELSHDQK